MAQETTANAARDLNQLRIALHQDKLSYLGESWGTALGAVYRSLFPATAGRMWLDSVTGPADTVRDDAATRAAAAQRDFARFAAWIAARNGSYGFGATAAQVSAALLALSRALDATPVTFTDIPQPIDGSLVTGLSTRPSPPGPRTPRCSRSCGARPAAPPLRSRSSSCSPHRPYRRPQSAHPSRTIRRPSSRSPATPGPGASPPTGSPSS